MAQKTVIATSQKKTAVRKLNKNSKLFKTIIKSILDKKGEHIVSLDLRKIDEAVADFFIVCEAGSGPQIRAIADAVETNVKQECGEHAYKTEGFSALQWVLIDYVNVVVHIMQPATRSFYKIEEMWSDADVQEHGN